MPAKVFGFFQNLLQKTIGKEHENKIAQEPPHKKRKTENTDEAVAEKSDNAAADVAETDEISVVADCDNEKINTQSTDKK